MVANNIASYMLEKDTLIATFYQEQQANSVCTTHDVLLEASLWRLNSNEWLNDVVRHFYIIATEVALICTNDNSYQVNKLANK